MDLLLLILFVSLIVIGIIWLINYKESYYAKQAIGENKLLKNENKKLLEQNNTLIKYQHIVDVEKAANDILTEANNKIQESINYELTAKQHVDAYEKAIASMKNIIDGYGDKYIIPTYCLIDDLVYDFAYNETSQKLKLLKEKISMMNKKWLAVKCEFADSSQHQNAKIFILDAFNNKVDTIFSKIKKDNFGILKQKIYDAFNITNLYGRTFLNTVILDDYLDARIEELKLVVILQELKLKEQEEQRIIKDQIRDEEKAKKEIEKAIREAKKEEDLLKSLIEKAQNQIAQSTETQKAMYEEKLKELEQKLSESVEKNQRALSMAQQTKSGNVYIISNIGSFGENVYKIGMTRRLEPLDRIKELGDASVPFEFDVHAMIYCDDAPKLENELHKKFMISQMNKVNPRKEFFRIELVEIKNVICKLGIDVKWTLLAEAKQFKETIAIEQAIKNDKRIKEEWERYQLQFEIKNPLTQDENNE